jgi:integrase
MWNLGIATGLRIGDLLKLRPAQIDRIFWIEEQKTKKIRGIFMTSEILETVNRYIREHRVASDGFLFYSSDSKKTKSMSRQWAHRIIARTASNLGLKCIGAHSMRKIYACGLFASTGSIKAVQSELGHKHMSTTLIYLKDLLETGS